MKRKKKRPAWRITLAATPPAKKMATMPIWDWLTLINKEPDRSTINTRPDKR